MRRHLPRERNVSRERDLERDYRGGNRDLRDRDRERDRDRGRDRDRDGGMDKERYGRWMDTDKSMDRDRSRDKDRQMDRRRDLDRSRSRGKHRSRDSSRDKPHRYQRRFSNSLSPSPPTDHSTDQKSFNNERLYYGLPDSRHRKSRQSRFEKHKNPTDTAIGISVGTDVILTPFELLRYVRDFFPDGVTVQKQSKCDAIQYVLIHFNSVQRCRDFLDGDTRLQSMGIQLSYLSPDDARMKRGRYVPSTLRDWLCRECYYHNWATRDECIQCHKQLTKQCVFVSTDGHPFEPGSFVTTDATSAIDIRTNAAVALEFDDNAYAERAAKAFTQISPHTNATDSIYSMFGDCATAVKATYYHNYGPMAAAAAAAMSASTNRGILTTAAATSSSTSTTPKSTATVTAAAAAEKEKKNKDFQNLVFVQFSAPDKAQQAIRNVLLARNSGMSTKYGVKNVALVLSSSEALQEATAITTATNRRREDEDMEEAVKGNLFVNQLQEQAAWGTRASAGITPAVETVTRISMNNFGATLPAAIGAVGGLAMNNVAMTGVVSGGAPLPTDYGIANTFQWSAAHNCFYDSNSGFYFDIYKRLYYFNGAYYAWDDTKQSYVTVNEAATAVTTPVLSPTHVSIPVNDGANKPLKEPTTDDNISTKPQSIKFQLKKPKPKPDESQNNSAAETNNVSIPSPSTSSYRIPPMNNGTVSVVTTVTPISSAPIASPLVSSNSAVQPTPHSFLDPSLHASAHSFLDFDTICCKLCRTRLKSIEKLMQHSLYSKLHISNLMKWQSEEKSTKEALVVKRRQKKDDTPEKEEDPDELLKQSFLSYMGNYKSQRCTTDSGKRPLVK